MKKLLIFTLVLGALAFVAPSAEARTTTDAAETQSQWQRDRYNRDRRYDDRRRNDRRWNDRRYNRGARSVIRTRTRRIGFRVYRETYRVTYLPNGRTRTQVIRRVRIR